MIMKLGMEQYELKFNKVYINDDPELTLTHSRPRYQVSVYRTIGPLVYSRHKSNDFKY